MDVTLQRHCAKFIYVIPDGLRELMSDISREVLRSQPENLYTFITDYLDALMITRENARVAARVVQAIIESSESIVEFLQRTNMSRSEADAVVTIIQRAFKKHLDEQSKLKEPIDEEAIILRIIQEAGITTDQANEAAEIIQTAFRTHQMKREKERELGLGIIDWRIAARSAIHLYRRTGVTPDEANRAACLIQAAYKGYYTRQLKKKLLDRPATPSEVDSSSSSGDNIKNEFSVSTVGSDSIDDVNAIEVVESVMMDILERVVSADESVTQFFEIVTKTRKFDRLSFDDMDDDGLPKIIAGNDDDDDNLNEDKESLKRFVQSLLIDQLPFGERNSAAGDAESHLVVDKPEAGIEIEEELEGQHQQQTDGIKVEDVGEEQITLAGLNMSPLPEEDLNNEETDTSYNDGETARTDYTEELETETGTETETTEYETE